MSIEYSARIIIGLPCDEIIDKSCLNDDDFVQCPLYYDATCGNMIVGILYSETDAYSAEELTWDESIIKANFSYFFEVTGQQPKIWLCTYGS